MSFFPINFNILVQQLIPPLLRKPIEIAWLKSLGKPLQYNNDNFITYISGSTFNPYNNSVSYTSGSTVTYIDRCEYSNISGSTGIIPTDINYWVKLNDNYIGAIERSKYNAQRYLYEYALNRWFLVPNTTTSTVFSPSNNNIYIQTTTASTQSFLMGQTGPYSSNMTNNGIYSTSFMTNNYITPSSYDYTVYVPNYIYTANTESTIRSFCDTLNISGMMYNVLSY
jgi:hypothetical protein